MTTDKERDMPATIDIHAHVVPADFPVAPTGCGHVWPCMRHHPDDQASVFLGEREFRRVDNRAWSVPRRVADMDGQDVAIQALSPMPELLSYWIDAGPALELTRSVNGAIAAMVAEAPARFAGLGTVPLQDPDLAARELERMKADGFSGVEIGSNILGRSPGDAHFDPFFETAERLGMAVFVHALHPTMTDRIVGPKVLAAFIGFPVDTGLAAASCITGGTLTKFPKLRLGFSHGGGMLASILPRLQRGWTIAPELQAAFAAPTDAARGMFYDTIVFDPATLRHLIATFGETQVFAASDYPFAAGQSHPGRPFEALDLPPATLELLKSGNARRFLGLA